MSELRPNDTVECINDTPTHAESRVMPRLGQLYTVTKVRRVEGGYSVRLRELLPTCYAGGPCDCGGCGWDAGRFRSIHRPSEALTEARSVRLCEAL